MKLKGKKIGFVMTGSFCIFRKTIEQLQKIVDEKAIVIPVMSYNAYNFDTKFGKAKEFINEIQKITRKRSYTYNSRSRVYWAKTSNRYNDCSTSNWKYHGQTSQ